jgi:hypothetical protein
MPVLSSIQVSFKLFQAGFTQIFVCKQNGLITRQSGRILNKSNRSAGSLQRGQVVHVMMLEKEVGFPPRFLHETHSHLSYRNGTHISEVHANNVKGQEETMTKCGIKFLHPLFLLKYTILCRTLMGTPVKIPSPFWNKGNTPLQRICSGKFSCFELFKNVTLRSSSSNLMLVSQSFSFPKETTEVVSITVPTSCSSLSLKSLIFICISQA